MYSLLTGGRARQSTVLAPYSIRLLWAHQRRAWERPVILGPAQRPDPQLGRSVVQSVVVVVDQPVRRAVDEDRLSPRPAITAAAGQDLCGSAHHHRPAVCIDIGAGDVLRAPHHDTIRALRAATTKVERDEEEKVVASTYDVGRLDGIRPRRAVGKAV